jgi:hypothetical protein
MKRISLVLPIVVFACRSAADSPSIRSAPSTDVVLSLHPYFRELRVVQAMVGQDTLTLLLDTGGGATLITPETARAHGCQPHGADVGHRMTGEPVIFQRCDSLPMRLGAWQVTLSPIGVFDVNALLPAQLPRVDGVLALDAFAARVVTVDWPNGTLTLHGPTHADSALAATGIPIRIASGESGRFLTVLVRVEGTHEPLWFLLDSGNLRGTLIAKTVTKDSLLPLRAANEALLRIGGRPPVPLTFQSTDLILDGVLGTDYFQRGNLTLDLRRLTR